MSLDNLSGSTGSLDYPEIRPALDLNFARTKALDARVSFNRSSGGTYVGADGLIKIAGVNQPRFDHDPITGECLGLMIEEGRTNHEPNYSGAFGMAYSNWTADTSIIAPDGTNTVYFNTFNQLSGARFFNDFNPAGNNTYTCSVYARLKPGSTATTLYVNVKDWQSDLIRGFSPAITLTNQWQRISATGTTLGGGGQPGLRFEIYTNTNGDAAQVYLWGAQVEVGSFMTSYIPTGTSAVTRAGESAGITGTNFNNFYNKTEGTAFIRSRNSYNQFPFGHNGAGFGFYRTGFFGGGWAFSHGRDRHVNIPGGYGADWRSLHPYVMSDSGAFSSTTPWNSTTFPIVTNSATTFVPGAMAIDSQTYIVASRGYKSDIYRHGVDMPNPVGLALGSDPNYSAYSAFSGTISNFTYWPKRLPINVIQNITK